MDHPSARNFDDIYRMHRLRNLGIGAVPTLLRGDARKAREDFLREELLEFQTANQKGDLPGAADALIDLVVVAMGTAVLMGLPWQQLWDDVHRANMEKEPAPSERMHGLMDLIKPPGWTPPQTEQILERWKDGVPGPMHTPAPRVVCLCGSTRFQDAYEYWNRHFTLKGYVVLTVGFFGHQTDEPLSATTKAKLDELHLHKIDLAHGIFVINPGNYIGESTRAEIEYAEATGKEIRYLEEPPS